MSDKLKEEAKAILELLEGKCISKVFRPRIGEICIEFSDGSRFFTNAENSSSLEFSVTDGASE